MKDLKFQTAEQTMKHNNKEGDSDFYTNMNKGFAMAINGYRISVQWGPHNYVSDSDIRYSSENPQEYDIWGCDTAEVLIWDEKGRFAKHAGGSLFEVAPWNDEADEYDFEWCNEFQFGHNDQVFGNCSSDCVAKMISTLVNCGDEDPRNAIGQIYEFDIKNQ
jgi:hypothetical protein